LSLLIKIRNYFITGLVVTLPLVATIYIVWILYNFLESHLRPIYQKLLGFYIPGSAIVLTFLAILIVGIFAKVTVGEKIILTFEKYLARVPFINDIYLTVKQASSILFLKKSEFKTVVLVEFPRKGIYVIGLTTAEAIKEIKEKTGGEFIHVFIPTTPVPTSGYLIIARKDELIPLDISVEEALKLIITGGFAGAIKDLKKTSEV